MEQEKIMQEILTFRYVEWFAWSSNFGCVSMLTTCLHRPIWVFPRMVVPPKHPKMVIFSRKTNSRWGNPPF